VLLRDLTIENYRSFDKYKLDGLARVNLLVGDNNCGKTSVLEAVTLLTCHADARQLCRVQEIRGDVVIIRDSSSEIGQTHAVRAAEVFHGLNQVGRKIPRIEISSTGFGIARLSLGPFGQVTEEADPELESFGQIGHISNLNASPIRPELDSGCVLFCRFFGDGFRLASHSTTSEGFLRWEAPYGIKGNNRTSAYHLEDFPVRYMPANLETADSLKLSWSNVLLKGTEQKVTEAVGLVVPELSQIHFLPSQNTPPNARADILLDTRGVRRSLSAFGEGTQRVLRLGIELSESREGIACVDEIDTGLHYSRLPDMWRMVVKTAQELDVQVFATTHSLDCIRGLAYAVAADESLTDDVAIFKIDRRMDHAARFDGSELEIIAEQEIEVR
jgi:hypothetical protein